MKVKDEVVTKKYFDHVLDKKFDAFAKKITKDIVGAIVPIIDEKIGELARATAAGFAAVDKRFEKLEKRMERIEIRFKKLEKRVGIGLHEIGDRLEYFEVSRRLEQQEIDTLDKKIEAMALTQEQEAQSLPRYQ